MSGNSMAAGRMNETRPGPRGRGATTPTDIPAKGWKDIVLRVFNQMGEDRVMLIAAGVTYYLLLALVPALSATVSIFGVIADPATVRDFFNSMSSFIPGGGMDIISEQLERLTNQDNQTLGITFVISLCVALWSTNAGMKALFDAMNVAYDEMEERSFIQLTLVSLTFTFLAILGVIALILVAIALPIALNFVFNLDQNSEWLIQIASLALLLVAFTGAIACLYRYGPSRDRAKWRWITPGSILASVVIALASLGFSFYVANFGSYNATYGSLGAIIGFMTWIWISTTILILGAEFNAESERQTKRDSTVGKRQPMGARDAFAADDLGPRAENIDDDGPDAGAGIGAKREKADGSKTREMTRRRAGLSPSALLVMVPLAVMAGLLSRRD